MNQTNFTDGLLDFIRTSPTPFHAVESMISVLDANGFQRLNESDRWDIGAGKYYVTRNDSSIIVFRFDGDPEEHGFRMVGAHTDSPCLKVKPNPELVRNGCLQLGVEPYGGVLLNTWFDRDLSIAGRVNYLDAEGEIARRLIDLKEAVATIPSLAIHLDRNANKEHPINEQLHLPPVLMNAEEDAIPELRSWLLEHMAEDTDGIKEVLDYELCLYDTQAPAYIGREKDFIASARLDNLLSCYTGLHALIDADSGNALLVCNDHEEVGSASTSGAQGTFLRSVLDRLISGAESFARLIDRSMLISTDNAHAIHPNYPDKHDENHGPILNQGPVIKVNSNQRYATNSETSSLFRNICRQADVPVQTFVTRSDMGCGSTIGPITATNLGVRTIDVGVPTYGMHSIRELAGSRDAWYLYQALRRYF